MRKSALVMTVAVLLGGCGTDTAKTTRDGSAGDAVHADSGAPPDRAPEVDLAPEPDLAPEVDLARPDASPDAAGDAGADLAGDGAAPDSVADLAAADAADQGTAADAATLPSASCSSPQTLTLSAGAVTVNGDTTGQADEFAIDCSGDLSFVMDGPQLYYRVGLLKGKGYRALVTPAAFDVGVYAFPASTPCTVADVNAGCMNPPNDRAARLSADAGGSGKPEYLHIEPAADEDWIVVVDSYNPNQSGSFTLEIAEYIPPSNGVCGAPQPVALNSSPVSVTGDTAGLVNEFDQDIDCGTSFSFDGPQLYYKLNLSPAVTYTVTVTPTAQWDPALYAFEDPTCTPATIDSECVGQAADVGYGGDPETITISSPTAATYVVAVDTSLSTGGPFKLTISW